MTPRLLLVLLADDNEDHRFLTKRAIETVREDGTPVFRVVTVSDGDEAIDYVRQRGRFTHAPRPDFVLADIKMPRKDGFAVLADLKGDPATRAIPVIMLTSSDTDRDVARAYALGANSYVTKPLDVHAFQRRISDVAAYWRSVAVLPGNGAP